MECPICKEDIKEGATVCIRCRHYIDERRPVIRFLYNYVKRLAFGISFVALLLNIVLNSLTFFKK